MIKILATCTMLLFSITMMAEKAVELTAADNSKTVFVMSAEPVIHFKNQTMVLTAQQQEIHYYLFDGNVKARIIDITTDIKTPDKQTPKYTLTQDGLSLEGMGAGERIDVYSINGMLVGHYLTDQSGHASINLNGNSIYIVKVGNNTIKIKLR